MLSLGFTQLTAICLMQNDRCIRHTPPPSLPPSPPPFSHTLRSWLCTSKQTASKASASALLPPETLAQASKTDITALHAPAPTAPCPPSSPPPPAGAVATSRRMAEETCPASDSNSHGFRCGGISHGRVRDSGAASPGRKKSRERIRRRPVAAFSTENVACVAPASRRLLVSFVCLV